MDLLYVAPFFQAEMTYYRRMKEKRPPRRRRSAQEEEGGHPWPAHQLEAE